MAKLAIKGHATRGKEVIEILEMLGGINSYTWVSDDESSYYSVGTDFDEEEDVIIPVEDDISNYTYTTLEEFLEKFPYKVGDKVIYEDKVREVTKMVWEEQTNTVAYKLDDKLYCNVIKELQPCKEETNMNEGDYCETLESKIFGYKVDDIVFTNKTGWIRITGKLWDCYAKEHVYEGVGLLSKREYDNISHKDIICKMAPGSDIENIKENKPLFKTGDIVKLKGCPDKNQFWIVMDVVKDGYIFNDGKKYSFDEQHHYEKSNREVILTETPYKKETMEENLNIQDIRDNNAEWLLNKLREMTSESAWQTLNNLYDELNKSKYPKTYEECCKVLGYSGNYNMILTTDVDNKLFNALYRLKVCRDAYWKIAGEQMGLGKPWEPDWLNVEQDKFVLYTHDNVIWLNCFVLGHNVLAFPTAEMRDTFFENFKNLIENCKELL